MHLLEQMVLMVVLTQSLVMEVMELMDKMGVKVIHTTPYDPRCAPIERANHQARPIRYQSTHGSRDPNPIGLRGRRDHTNPHKGPRRIMQDEAV